MKFSVYIDMLTNVNMSLQLLVPDEFTEINIEHFVFEISPTKLLSVTHDIRCFLLCRPDCIPNFVARVTWKRKSGQDDRTGQLLQSMKGHSVLHKTKSIMKKV